MYFTHVQSYYEHSYVYFYMFTLNSTTKIPTETVSW